MKSYALKLSREEALLLDGHVSAEAQRVVDVAKAASALLAAAGGDESIARFVAEVVDAGVQHDLAAEVGLADLQAELALVLRKGAVHRV